MGLFSFLKKKESAVAPPDLLPLMPGTAPQTDMFKNDADLNALNALPPFPNSFSEQELQAPPQSDTLALNLPPLDTPLASQTAAVDMPLMPPQMDAAPDDTLREKAVQSELLDPDTLKNLFISDDQWKNPDLTTYDPYHENKIEPPVPQDFARSDLPDFDTLAAATPEESVPTRIKNDLAVYVRGSDCVAATNTLKEIDALLTKQDAHRNALEGFTSHEQLFIDAKNSTEYIQKRLMQIDHKLFP